MDNHIKVPAKAILVPTNNKSNFFIKTHKGVYGDLILPSDRKLEYTTNETRIRNIHLISSGNAATNVKDIYSFYNLYIVLNKKPRNIKNHFYLKNGDLCLSKNNSFKLKKEDLDFVIAAADYSFSNKKHLSPNLIPESFISKIVESYNNKNVIEDVLVDYENDGIWHFERSSGYAGYRCQNCAEWIYSGKELRCDCDRVRVNEKNEIFISEKKTSFDKNDFKELIIKMWSKSGLSIVDVPVEDALNFVDKNI